MAKKPSEKQVGNGVQPLTRYGKVLYESNPSIAGSFPVRMRPKTSTKISEAYMVAPGTGEVIAQGAFGFVEEQEIDEAQFVKIYLDGVKQYGQLSKAGALLFEFVYKEMSGRSGKDKDTVILSYLLAQRWNSDLTKRTYERGMWELLEKGFLFRSMAADVYFVNIRFMFNGNRMDVIKRYRVKGVSPQPQPDLFDAVPDALPALKEE